ncbi:MAG: M23 family metallopeptidase [Treponemataceae bacterium]|nr:M23 family metallopeptidase [Treponemataceae bacterium]
MEIISFLDARAYEGSDYEPASFDKMLEKQRVIQRSLRKKSLPSVRTAQKISSEPYEIIKVFSSSVYGLRWFFAVVAAVALASLLLFRVYSYIISRPQPAVFTSEDLSAESYIVDSAMKQLFVEDGYSEVSDDGTIADVTVSLPFSRAVEYSEYVVASGDNITNISRKYGLSNISTLISVNNIENVRKLWVGQKLKIPSMDGIAYKVGSGDTLASLSAKYGISVEDILDVNELTSDILYPGSVLFIPGGKLDSESLKKSLGELWIKPLACSYRVTSQFGYRADPFTGVRSYHTGIDLAVSAGTPIRACMGGTVSTAGWSNIYGNYVIISHSNGYQTLYAHMTKYTVTKGEKVNQGQNIGYVGSTGYSTGPHLHFSVYKNSQLVSPSTILKL